MMKRFVTAICALLFLGTSSVMAQAVIKFGQASHNFGAFAKDTTVTHVFKFINDGDKPLVIQQAFASCGCTVADFTKEPVAPGKEGEVRVSYNGQKQFPGFFKKSVTVRSNASNSIVRVYIEGTLKEK